MPLPGPRHWIPAATAMAAGLLTLRCHTTDALYWLPPTLPIAIFGPWMAAIVTARIRAVRPLRRGRVGFSVA